MVNAEEAAAYECIDGIADEVKETIKMFTGGITPLLDFTAGRYTLPDI